jgi:hypothetical protein
MILWTGQHLTRLQFLTFFQSSSLSAERDAQYFLDDLERQNITITRFYAASAMPVGIALLRRAKFEERGRVGKRMVFEKELRHYSPWGSGGDFRKGRAKYTAIRRFSMRLAGT